MFFVLKKKRFKLCEFQLIFDLVHEIITWISDTKKTMSYVLFYGITLEQMIRFMSSLFFF